MRRELFLVGFLILVSPWTAFSQTSILGQWKTIDDKTGDVKSIVEISERNGEYFGKIIKIFPKKGQNPDPICDKCPDDDPRKNKKIIGMEIIRNMKKDGEEYTGGKVLKPDEGDIYRCKIWTENGNLKVRGYLGFFYRTQTWLKVN